MIVKRIDITPRLPDQTRSWRNQAQSRCCLYYRSPAPSAVDAGIPYFQILHEVRARCFARGICSV